MAILKRFTKKYMYLISNDPDESCSQDTIELVYAVKTLTNALEKIRDCRDTAGVKSFIAKEELRKVWGDDS